jgi:hypothetical protein
MCLSYPVGMADVQDVRRVAVARDGLRRACSDLVDPQVADVAREDGTVTRHVAPALIDQLRGAVATGREAPQGPRGRNRPLVISPPAHDLLRAIEADVGLWPWAERGPLVQRIRGTVATLCRTTDLASITTVDRHLTVWSADIRALLTPPRHLHLAAPCPACEARMAWVHDPQTGERVQVYALQVAPSPATGELQCECLRCAVVWDSGHLELLARALE